MLLTRGTSTHTLGVVALLQETVYTADGDWRPAFAERDWDLPASPEALPDLDLPLPLPDIVIDFVVLLVVVMKV